jgi:hypothetical protein
MLRKDDKIVTAYAEPAAGPGWSNQPLWVIVRRGGELFEECLQPHEQTAEMLTLYQVSAAAHSAMRGAVSAMLATKPRVKKEG